MRVQLLREIGRRNKKRKCCFLSQLAEKFGLSHVAVKKHLDLLVQEGYITEINPQGKPIYLEVSRKGLSILKEFRQKL